LIRDAAIIDTDTIPEFIQPPSLVAMSKNPRYSDLPADAMALLEDPRVAGIVDGPQNYPGTERVLNPDIWPPTTPSDYLQFERSFKSDPASGANWVNAPPTKGWAAGEGDGCGFERVKERPRIEHYGKPPAVRAPFPAAIIDLL
jgi:hypothetical protein